MPERYAMQALSHSSKAVHRAYSAAGNFTVPSLETYENGALSNGGGASSPQFPSPVSSEQTGNGVAGKLASLIAKLIEESPDGLAALRTILGASGEDAEAA